MGHRLSPILRYGLSYLSSILLAPGVFLCAFMLLVGFSTIVDRNPLLEQWLFRFLANFPAFDQRTLSHHFGKEDITRIGWVLWGVLGIGIEGIKCIVKKFVPYAFPSSYKARLAIGSAFIWVIIGFGVALIDYGGRTHGIDQRPLLMFLLVFLFSWVSLALGLAVQRLSDNASEDMD